MKHWENSPEFPQTQESLMSSPGRLYVKIWALAVGLYVQSERLTVVT